MALLWLEGFERFGNSGDQLPAVGTFGDYYTASSNLLEQATVVLAAGRKTGLSLNFTAATTTTRYFSLNEVLDRTREFTIGFAVKFNSVNTNTNNILRIGRTSTVDTGTNLDHLILRYVGSSQAMQVWRLNGTLSGTVPITPLQWNYFEFQFRLDSTVGFYRLRINGTQVINVTEVDTNASSAGEIISFGKSTSHTLQLDDIYILDNVGSTNNTFLGPSVVETLRPNGVGNSTGLTPSAGANWECVDEVLHNADTDYVETTTDGAKDLYTFTDLQYLSGTIHGVVLDNFARKTETANYNLQHVIRHSASEEDSAVNLIDNAGYVLKNQAYNVNPVSTTAWTVADINNVEIGFKVTTP